MLIFLNLNLGHRDDIRHRDDILTTGGCESSQWRSPRINKNVQGELKMELLPKKNYPGRAQNGAREWNFSATLQPDKGLLERE